MIEKQPNEIIVINLECVLLPNGDIISLGKVIGSFEKYKKHLSLIKK